MLWSCRFQCTVMTMGSALRHWPCLNVSVPFPSDSGSSLSLASDSCGLHLCWVAARAHPVYSNLWIPWPRPRDFISCHRDLHQVTQVLCIASSQPYCSKKNMCTLIKVLGFDDKKGLAFLPARCRQVRDSWYTYADNGESFVPLKTNKSDVSRSCSCSEKHQART